MGGRRSGPLFGASVLGWWRSASRRHLGRLAFVKDVPIEELPVIGVDGLGDGDPPTADDVTTLRDGTRLDTPAKLIAYVEQFKAEMAARAPHRGAARGA